MATNNYIAAAKKPGKKPVIKVSIEDPASVKTYYTTKADWDGSVTKNYIETSSVVGSVLPFYQIAATNQDGWKHPDGFGTNFAMQMYGNALITPAITSFAQTFRVAFSYYTTGAGISFPLVTLKIRSGSATGTVLASSAINLDIPFEASYQYIEGENLKYFQSAYYTFNFVSENQELTASTNYYITAFIAGVGETGTDRTYTKYEAFGPGLIFQELSDDVDLAPKNGADCNLTTSTVDLGAIPSGTVGFTVSDLTPSGTSLVYSAVGGNTDPPGTSLGTIVDGDELAAYRYYRITAQFSSTAAQRPRLDEFVFSEDVFRVYSTEKNQPPGLGAMPYLIGDSVKTSANRVKLLETPTIGETSFALHATVDVKDLISTGFLRNKAVKIDHGFDGLSDADYEPYFVGTWQDYEFQHDAKAPEFKIKIRDALKQFSDVRIPLETVDTSGNKTTAPFATGVGGDNALDALMDIIDAIGINDRYIDRAYAAELTGLYGELDSDIFLVNRTISTPKNGLNLITELATIAGVFLIVRPDGKLTWNLYRPEITPTYTLDAKYHTFATINGNQRELKTRQLLYYDVAAGVTIPRDTEEDYDKAYINIDADAETKWGEVSEQLWFEKWSEDTTAIALLSERMRDWHADPRALVNVKNVPFHFANLQNGDVVNVNRLAWPLPKIAWDSSTTYDADDKIIYNGQVYQSIQSSNLNKQPDTNINWWDDVNVTSTGLTDNKKFLVSMRAINPISATIDYGLREVPNYYEAYAAGQTVTVGTVSSGGYSDTQTADGTFFEVTEASATPGLDFELTFSGVKGIPKRVEAFLVSSIAGGDTINVQAYNYSTTSFDAIGTYAETTAEKKHYFLGLDKNHVSSGAMRIRFYLSGAGTGTHVQKVDKIRVVSRGA